MPALNPTPRANVATVTYYSRLIFLIQNDKEGRGSKATYTPLYGSIEAGSPNLIYLWDVPPTGDTPVGKLPAFVLHTYHKAGVIALPLDPASTDRKLQLTTSPDAVFSALSSMTSLSYLIGNDWLDLSVFDATLDSAANDLAALFAMDAATAAKELPASTLSLMGDTYGTVATAISTGKRVIEAATQGRLEPTKSANPPEATRYYYKGALLVPNDSGMVHLVHYKDESLSQFVAVDYVATFMAKPESSVFTIANGYLADVHTNPASEALLDAEVKPMGEESSKVKVKAKA